MKLRYLAVAAGVLVLFVLWFAFDWLRAQNQSIQLLAGLAAIAGFFLTLVGTFFAYSAHHSKREPPVSQPRGSSPADLAHRYYQALASDCQRVDMSVIDPSAAMEKNWVRLPQVYCDQRVTLPHKEKGNAPREVESQQPLPLLQAVGEADTGRVVILGPVGSGKSSFVNMLAWQVAQSHLGEAPKGLAAPLVRRPLVRIRLRNVARKAVGRANAELLWGAVSNEVRLTASLDDTDANTLLQEFRKSLNKGGVWLLDGLDEVPETDGARADLLDAIDALAGSLAPEARLLITSRPYAYASPEQQLAGWPVWTIQEMVPEQVAEFLNGWYRIMAPRKNWDATTAEKEAADLAQILDEREYLARMAGRPLLLTLIASLHIGSGTLPHNRGKLYEDALRLLLQRWHIQLIKLDVPMDPEVREILNQDAGVLEAALAELAFRTHERQGKERAAGGEPSDIEDVEVVGTFALHDIPHKELLHFLDSYSGILLGVGSGKFRFAHRSLQEYLAAVHLARSDQGAEKLLDYSSRQPDWWQEVLLMYLSRVSNFAPAVKDFLSMLLPEGWPDLPTGERNEQAPLLAGHALVDLRLPGQLAQWSLLTNLLAHTRSCLVGLVKAATLPPGQRLELGDLLAELVDPRCGIVQRDQRGCPIIDWVQIRVPTGRYTIGSDDADNEAYEVEKPPTEIGLGDFQISRFPITNAQFKCFIDAGGYRDPRWWPDTAGAWWRNQGPVKPLYWNDRRLAQPNRPVVGVCWYEARAFCLWLSDRLGFKVDLPTEAQWERAARGPGRLIWPWGNTWLDERCNSIEGGVNEPCAVGLFPAGVSAEGVEDMAGNIWEWTLSRWCGDYRKIPDDWNEPTDTVPRVLRGGSFNNARHDVRAAYRDDLDPAYRLNGIGFRVSCELSPIVKPDR